MEWSDRRDRLERALTSRRGTLGCMLALWACLVLAQCTPWTSVEYGDIPKYLVLARSLAQGEGYAMDGVPHRMIPPVFPLMLSAVSSPTRTDYRPENLVVALASLGVLIAAFGWVSGQAEGRKRFALAVLVAASPLFVRLSGKVLSDVPFLGFALLFLAAGNRFWKEPRADWRLGALSMAALGLAVLTRSAAMVFYAGCLVWLARPSLWRRDWRRCLLFGLLFVGIAVPPMVWWATWVRSQAVDGASSYGDAVSGYMLGGRPAASSAGLSHALAVARETIPEQLRNAGRAVFGAGTHGRHLGTALVALPLVLLGLLRRMRRPELQEICFCGYALLVILWPWPTAYRFWMPAVPWMLVYLLDGLQLVGRGVTLCARRVWPAAAPLDRAEEGRSLGWLPSLAAGALLIAYLASDVRIVRGVWRQATSTVGNIVLPREELDVARFALESRDRPATIACDHPGYLRVAQALRWAPARVIDIPFDPGTQPAAARHALERRGATHAAVEKEVKAPGGDVEDPLRVAALRAAIAALPESFRLARETDTVLIYEVLAPHR